MARELCNSSELSHTKYELGELKNVAINALRLFHPCHVMKAGYTVAELNSKQTANTPACARPLGEEFVCAGSQMLIRALSKKICLSEAGLPLEMDASELNVVNSQLMTQLAIYFKNPEILSSSLIY